MSGAKASPVAGAEAEELAVAEIGPVGRRPMPYPVTPSSDFQSALENKTRSPSGVPGPRYWQQWAEYELEARILPLEKRLEGSASIVYYNNSPDTLAVLVINLYQNLHAEGAPRLFPQEITGGVQLERVAVDGQELEEGRVIPPGFGGPGQDGPAYSVFATAMLIRPPRLLALGGRANIEIDRGFDVPSRGASGRMGWRDDNLFFMAYWYPQMAVYDDVVGWQFDGSWARRNSMQASPTTS